MARGGLCEPYAIGFVTESLQLPIPALGMEARPYGSILISNIGTYGLDSAAAPWPTFCHVPIGILMGAVADLPRVPRRAGVVRPGPGTSEGQETGAQYFVMRRSPPT